MIYGYEKISNINEQNSLLKSYGASEIYADINTDNKNFNILINKLKSGDTLIIESLIHLSRSLTKFHLIVNELLDMGVKIHILDIGIIDKDTDEGKLILKTLISVANYETRLISQRTIKGKEKSTKKDGRPPKYNDFQIEKAMVLLEDHTYKQVADITGISKATLYREKKKYESKKEKMKWDVDSSGQIPGQTDIFDYMN